MAVAVVAPKAKPLMRPFPGNCSAAAIAPTALMAPATQARMTIPNKAFEGEPPAIRENSAIGRIALHAQRNIRTDFRPRLSDKAPVNGVTRMTANAAAVDNRSESPSPSFPADARNVGT